MLLPHNSHSARRDSLIVPRYVALTRWKRAEEDNNADSKKTAMITVAIVVIAILAVSITIFVGLRILRKKQVAPKYLPTNGLKSRWRRWTSPKHKYQQPIDGERELTPSLHITRSQRDRHSSLSLARSAENLRDLGTEGEVTAGARSRSADPASSNDAGVDRNTSVRSVMTLPAYNPDPREHETVIGRAGERGGIDVVIEYPETMEEEEDRRDNEMESLYQIRRARRQEASDREERRRLRREARARGDWAEVERLRIQSRQRADSSATEEVTSAALIAEHQAATRTRERRVSSVQYADLGVARHDGSRVRGNSMNSFDSDNRPLLDSAASISGQSIHSRPISSRALQVETGRSFTHHRSPSATSVLSYSDAGTDDESFHNINIDQPAPTLRTSSNGTDFEIVNLNGGGPPQGTRSRASSASNRTFSPSFLTPLQTPGLPQEGSSDLGDSRIPIPIEDPPNYDGLGWENEEAPPYESPIRTRRPELPSLNAAAARQSSGTQERLDMGADSGVRSVSISPAGTPRTRSRSPGARGDAPRLPRMNSLPAIEVEMVSPIVEPGQRAER
ncbi:hypothetical protein K402DRAFT_401212 [Aulographum hederae CBS 113979]|uniref:Uncharacterized protein n=1 Tax=Aulographum hederae CBS 113979 TaxID=1176131 RepID=A0A6G1HBC3_9PEZI|nr:hypothetical protein K402DRAFT_401212 [Aulographum hederae CBS 113979]